jgi:glycosyltransferase involved in cell wall biosynthesis
LANILFVAGIFPPDPGGPASYVPRIATALAPRHDILGVVTLSDVPTFDDDYPFRVFRIPRPMNKLARFVRVVTTIRRLARKAHTVYLNGLVFEGIVACKLLSRRRVVVKVVGDLIWEKQQLWERSEMTIDDFQTARHPLKWRLLRALQSWYTRRADMVITPSNYLARIVAGWGVPSRRIQVVYNAAELEPRAPFEGEPQFDLVTVARLVPWKGLEALIDLSKKRGWTLKIVGDGPSREELHARAANAPSVHFAGRVAADKVMDEIRTARVFVLNSTYEGLPHVVLEAQAASVPVVATDVGGTGEAIRDGETGVLVPRGDTDALERAIDALLLSPARRRELAQNGARVLTGRFSFNTMLRDTEALLTR